MRLALGISYNGQAYEGWQSQPSGRTVQDRLEHALGQFAAQPVSTVCAGRTDAGVHGLMQVVHFDTPLEREEFSWVRGTNRFLPPDIAVAMGEGPYPMRSTPAPAPPRAATPTLCWSRRCGPASTPAASGGSSGRWTMQPCARLRRCLLGRHDFTSFRASACQAKSPVKTIKRIDITRRGAYWRFEFEADAFLHHMIRNIMGCLLAIGQGHQPPPWMAQVLAARDRDVAAPTFSPDGLYFMGPVYGPEWNLPSRTAAYDWLP